MLSDSCKPLYLAGLLMPHVLINLQNLSFFCEILSHIHYLLHVLVFKVNNLLESFLVHVDHLEIFGKVHLLPLRLILLWGLLLIRKLLLRIIALWNSLLGVGILTAKLRLLNLLKL